MSPANGAVNFANVVVAAEPGTAVGTGPNARIGQGTTFTDRNIASGEMYALARDWLMHCDSSESPHAAHEAMFAREVEQLACSALRGPLYRGRFFENPPKTSFAFGPPPDRNTVLRQRYNRATNPVLYLSTSEYGVSRELGQPKPGERLWLQRFWLPDSVTIADGRTIPDTSFGAAVFYVTESVRTEPPPALSATVAELVACRFDGMLVPGVRGLPEHLYSNVVIFHPRDRWMDFVDTSVPPYPHQER